MSEPVSIGIHIHAAPMRAKADGGDLDITFTKGAYPAVSMYCDSSALANDLATAINGVLAKHRDASAARAAAAEIERGE